MYHLIRPNQEIKCQGLCGNNFLCERLHEKAIPLWPAGRLMCDLLWPPLRETGLRHFIVHSDGWKSKRFPHKGHSADSEPLAVQPTDQQPPKCRLPFGGKVYVSSCVQSTITAIWAYDMCVRRGGRKNWKRHIKKGFQFEVTEITIPKAAAQTSRAKLAKM